MSPPVPLSDPYPDPEGWMIVVHIYNVDTGTVVGSMSADASNVTGVLDHALATVAEHSAPDGDLLIAAISPPGGHPVRDLWASELALLARMISDISEECYCSQWMTGAEFDVWRLATEGGEWGQGSADNLPQLAALRRFALHTGWWFIGYDRPVPMAEWLVEYETRLAERRAR